MCSAHAGVWTAHGRAYHRTAFLDERRDMMPRYADYLDQLRLAGQEAAA